MSEKKPFHAPLAGLEALKSAFPAAPSRAAAPAPAVAPPARAIVRLERKGHGGKEVTCVEKLSLSPQALESWLKQLKASLGCGGRVSEGALVFQGDQRERLEVLLRERGVQNVVLAQPLRPGTR